MKKIYYLPIAFIKLLCPSLFAAILLCSIAARAQQFSLFSPGGVAANESNDGQPLEIGFKFKVTQPGTLNAIRFYKSSGNGNGSYTANLWTNGNSVTPGINLSTATNPTISGSGWMEINIPDVTLLPNTVYVISVFSPSGWYSFTNNYFPTTPDDPGFPPSIIVANNTDPAAVREWGI